MPPVTASGHRHRAPAPRPQTTLLALALLLCALLAPGAASVAVAAPADDLGRAREMFRAGDYGSAIPLLNYLLYPKPRLASPQELAEAHLLLALSYYQSGDRRAAGLEIEAALFIDPDMTLDSSLFPAELVRFFQEKKSQMARQAERDEEKRRLAEERDAYRRALQNLVVIEKRDYFVNFIPFGAGQFQNGQRIKGVAFFVTEAVLGATSVAAYAAQIVKYGFTGPVPRDDVSSVRRLQFAQITTGGLCLGVMAWGIIDSLANYRPTIQRVPDESLLPRDWRRKRKGGNPPTSLRLVPGISPAGAGLGLSWTF
jgi:hypothetical protein